MKIVSVQHGYSHTPGRCYDIVDGKLKWGYIGKNKFEFIIGNKYKVSHANTAIVLHKNAVGIYKGSRQFSNGCYAKLECCGKSFTVSAEALIAYDGEITEEHLKLITPIKKVHLLENGCCACKCDSSPSINPVKLCIDEFLTIPENGRCKNCNNISKNHHKN